MSPELIFKYIVLAVVIVFAFILLFKLVGVLAGAA